PWHTQCTTHFPYTTLVRSPNRLANLPSPPPSHHPIQDVTFRRRYHRRSPQERAAQTRLPCWALDYPWAATGAYLCEAHRFSGRRDRKSTRLNSSHVSRSYD